MILRPLEEDDAAILQKWYMDKEFRLAYDAYESVELETIKEEIRGTKGGMYDPTLTKLPFLVLRSRDMEPIGVLLLKGY